MIVGILGAGRVAELHAPGSEGFISCVSRCLVRAHAGGLGYIPPVFDCSAQYTSFLYEKNKNRSEIGTSKYRLASSEGHLWGKCSTQFRAFQRAREKFKGRPCLCFIRTHYCSP